MCAERRITGWLKLLRIAADLKASQVEVQAMRVMNGTGPLVDGEFVRLAGALTAEIQRQQVALTTPWSRRREDLAAQPDERLQLDIERAWLCQRSGEGAVIAELQRLSTMLDELRSMVTNVTTS